MAYPAGMGERGALKSPREDSFASLASPLRSVGTQMASSSNDARGQLHRRFTTNNIPTQSTPLSPIGQQRRQAAEPTEFTTATYHKLQVVSIGGSPSRRVYLVSFTPTPLFLLEQ
ncbi:hypothetical protein BU26DRAFT_517455 [Trematosphaeria pertusa]|uniref:Uncharacterized protein n=1 Tax=Trematosphaeria pertusa TaxID=390896 RepID=A0A6A6IK96_9PLEO|nr:uncharacterized protein BU26DRAFT_517455 [Trematosphaeria pertusa]KAF2250629.1 hypothetical protein BU26DRAFT_517455 [Trematosphaeria pertusa]